MTLRKGSFECKHCGEEFSGVGTNIYCSVPCALWSKTVKRQPKDCWEWAGSKHKFGYGEFSFRGKLHRAHRVAYQLKHGWEDSPDVIRHTCDNPVCVNPNHLLGGTQADNMDDAAKRLRSGNRKIPIEAIPLIRQRRKAGETLSAIGKEYNVSPQAIRNIITGAAYKHF